MADKVYATFSYRGWGNATFGKEGDGGFRLEPKYLQAALNAGQGAADATLTTQGDLEHYPKRQLEQQGKIGLAEQFLGLPAGTLQGSREAPPGIMAIIGLAASGTVDSTGHITIKDGNYQVEVASGTLGGPSGSQHYDPHSIVIAKIDPQKEAALHKLYHDNISPVAAIAEMRFAGVDPIDFGVVVMKSFGFDVDKPPHNKPPHVETSGTFPHGMTLTFENEAEAKHFADSIHLRGSPDAKTDGRDVKLWDASTIAQYVRDPKHGLISVLTPGPAGHAAYDKQFIAPVIAIAKWVDTTKYMIESPSYDDLRKTLAQLANSWDAKQDSAISAQQAHHATDLVGQELYEAETALEYYSRQANEKLAAAKLEKGKNKEADLKEARALGEQADRALDAVQKLTHARDDLAIVATKFDGLDRPYTALDGVFAAPTPTVQPANGLIASPPAVVFSGPASSLPFSKDKLGVSAGRLRGMPQQVAPAAPPAPPTVNELLSGAALEKQKVEKYNGPTIELARLTDEQRALSTFYDAARRGGKNSNEVVSEYLTTLAGFSISARIDYDRSISTIYIDTGLSPNDKKDIMAVRLGLDNNHFNAQPDQLSEAGTVMIPVKNLTKLTEFTTKKYPDIRTDRNNYNVQVSQPLTDAISQLDQAIQLATKEGNKDTVIDATKLKKYITEHLQGIIPPMAGNVIDRARALSALATEAAETIKENSIIGKGNETPASTLSLAQAADKLRTVTNVFSNLGTIGEVPGVKDARVPDIKDSNAQALKKPPVKLGMTA